jgi:hypothetical protein
MTDTPVRQKIGFSNFLYEVDAFARWLGVSRASAMALLKDIKVPVIYVKKRIFFNIYTLDRVLYYLSRLTSPGYAAPGSNFKTKLCDRKLRRKKRGSAPLKAEDLPRLELTDADIEYMTSDARFIAEWQACNPYGRGLPSYLAILSRTKKKRRPRPTPPEDDDE